MQPAKTIAFRLSWDVIITRLPHLENSMLKHMLYFSKFKPTPVKGLALKYITHEKESSILSAELIFIPFKFVVNDNDPESASLGKSPGTWNFCAPTILHDLNELICRLSLFR